jgi:hypothetical protein
MNIRVRPPWARAPPVYMHTTQIEKTRTFMRRAGFEHSSTGQDSAHLTPRSTYDRHNINLEVNMR